MRIYTLGTSHGDSTFSRFNSSTVYETENGIIYLVDAGAPCEALLRRKGLNIKHVRAVFVTHMHDDHAGGLTGLIKQVRKYDRLRENPCTLFLPEETAIVPLQNWMAALHESCGSIAFRGVDDGIIYDDESLTVTAIRTAHLRTNGRREGVPCSFAYVLHFKKENKKILHTGDLWLDFSDFPKIAAEEDFDVCLCEATHYKPDTAIPVLEKSRFKKLVFIHVADQWHVRIDAAWNIDNGEKRLLDFCSGLPYPVVVAHDGDEFLV